LNDEVRGEKERSSVNSTVPGARAAGLYTRRRLGKTTTEKEKERQTITEDRSPRKEGKKEITVKRKYRYRKKGNQRHPSELPFQTVSRILMEDDLTFNEQDQLLKTLLKNNVHQVVHFYHHGIGVSDNLWREDWALARLNDGQGSSNGLWGRLGNAYQDLSIGTVLGFSDERQLDDGIGVSNALPGDTIIKVGATTMPTVSIITLAVKHQSS
jgi:hypothetical protein